MEGFIKKSASLILLIVTIVLFQIKIFPWISSYLRIDLFLCFVMSLCMFTAFPYSLILVLVISYLLQAFSGAGAGYLPFCYTGAYLMLDLIKNILFLDTVPAQIVLGFLISMLMNLSAVLFSDMAARNVQWMPIIICSLLTAAACPFFIRFSRRVLVHTGEA